MTDRYQFTWITDHGATPFTAGNVMLTKVWANAVDGLRFHTGAGFRLYAGGKPVSPVTRLWEMEPVLKAHLDRTPLDAHVAVRSEKDGWEVVFRRHAIVPAIPDQMVGDYEAMRGVQYVFGAQGPHADDCSGLVRYIGDLNGIEDLGHAHLAAAIAKDSRVLKIPRAKIKPMDLVFHRNYAHVSQYLDDHLGGRTWNTQPSNTRGPSGWPGVWVGTGVQIAPMASGWYCDWEHVDWVGRILAVNGPV